MGWTKPSLKLESILDDCIAGRPFLVKQKMFGSPGYLINGHMLAGVIENTLVFRLPEDEAVRAAAEIPGLIPFLEMAGRKMRGYAVLPGESPARAIVEDLIWRSLEYVEGMPPKVKKTGKG